MTKALSLAAGLLMVAAGAVEGNGAALVASTAAAVAVVVGLLIRVAATLAVASTVLALALSQPSPWSATIAGGAAAAYLMLRHARGGDAAITPPAVYGAAGLSAVALLGAAIPIGLPWVPLVAPLAVLVVYVVTVAPLVE